jgi:hypothetical protein
MGTLRKFVSTMILLAMIYPSPLSGLKDEYYRKVALFKAFAEYIKWPEKSSIKDLSKSFVIMVIGKNPFNDLLEKAYYKEKIKIKGKTVKIRYISSPTEIHKCHILFISKSVEKELRDILAVTRGKPILTIGETKGFAEKGVLFNLYIHRDEIRFEINALALRESGLIPSSPLLSLAKIVGPLEAPQ